MHNGSKRMSTFCRHTTKFPYGELVFTAKFPYGEKSVRRKLLRRNILMAKLPYGEISLRRNFLTAKYPTAKYPTAKYLTAKFPVTLSYPLFHLISEDRCFNCRVSYHFVAFVIITSLHNSPTYSCHLLELHFYP